MTITAGEQRLIPYEESRTAWLGGISRTTLHQLVTSGQLTRVKIGARGFITRESLEQFVAGLTPTARD